MKPHEINSLDNFIAGWYLDDTSICDELIQYHKDSPDKRPGVMQGVDRSRVDKQEKDSMDVAVPPNALARKYVQMLNNVASQYVAKYPRCAELVPWGIVEPFGIQWYRPGGGYRKWHFERDNSNDQNARRHLAFMTYLNDVEEGGGTEFLYQKLTITAEKGLTLVWPSEWIFTHRGVVSETQEKYIVTGWFSTYTRDQYENIAQRFGQRTG